MRLALRSFLSPGWRAPSRESRDALFMLALIAWTIAPHLGHLPLWVGALALGVLGWRTVLALRQAPLPGRTTVLALLALAAALTFWGERTLVGKEAGVTLLVVLMALKTLELRARRDALVVFFLGFFLVLTNFLYSQSLAIAFSMGVSVWGWLTALTLAHIPAGRPSVWQAAKLAGRAALVGTPVMVALFLLFPRVGPLWALPSDTGRSGLSDHLSLGGLADLANDDSIAFRLKFDGPTPPQWQLYFRGPVLTDTDGHAWTAATLFETRERPEGALPWSRVTLRGKPIHYTMTLEPTQLTWLTMLETTPPPFASDGRGGLADAAIQPLDDAPIHVLADVNNQWRTRAPIAQRVRLSARAWLDASSGVGASPAELLRNLALPPGAHPRTRAWAAQWAARHASPMGQRDADAIVAALYTHIATAGFSYTLTPGAYEADPVDEFWLGRRAGFCEHFATAFVVVLRALGVPSRVVTGYQGSDASPTDGSVIVRQSNAHAWAEYWSPARGWVRADPTAAVAPERISRGQALRPAPGIVGSAIDAMNPDLLERLRALRETIDNRWNEWVLGFNRGSQYEMMRRAGISTPDADDLGRAMIVIIVGAALLGAAMAWWDAHRRTPGQRLARALAASLRPLAAMDVHAAEHESPGTVAALLRRRFGAPAEALAARLDGLERHRYGPQAGAPTAPGAARAEWRAIRGLARSLAASLAAAGRA
jgi:transglutaminase-like putative cysteine protease